MSPVSTEIDYRPVLRARIEQEVTALLLAGSSLDPRPDYASLGYMSNSHLGYALFEEGELICGLPVRINRMEPRTIRVGEQKTTW